MTTARLFRNGRSQAVRIPKEFEFNADEVEIIRTGEGLYLYPKHPEPWANVRKVAEQASDYPEKVPSAPEQARDLKW